jgi:hypothetical protein
MILRDHGNHIQNEALTCGDGQDEEQKWQQERTGEDGKQAVAGLHELWRGAASQAGQSMVMAMRD